MLVLLMARHPADVSDEAAELRTAASIVFRKHLERLLNAGASEKEASVGRSTTIIESFFIQVLNWVVEPLKLEFEFIISLLIDLDNGEAVSLQSADDTTFQAIGRHR